MGTKNVTLLGFPPSPLISEKFLIIQFVDDGNVTGVFEDHTDKNKLMSMRQIRIMTNQSMKNIQSLSKEQVLHDPAGLFVHLCVSTCEGK